MADKTLEDVVAEKNGVRVSKSDSIYLSSEGRRFVELHTIASELNRVAKGEVTFKVGESEC